MAYYLGKNEKVSKGLLTALGMRSNDTGALPSAVPIGDPGAGAGGGTSGRGSKGSEGTSMVGTGMDLSVCEKKCWEQYPGETYRPGSGSPLNRCLDHCKTVMGDDTGGGDSAPYAGCPRAKKTNANSQADCLAGEVFISKPNNPGFLGQCECSKWCQDSGYAADCVTKVGTGAGAMGEYQYPQDMQDLMGRLTGRANEYLNKKPGYGAAALDNMFGQNFDKVRGAGEATRQQTRSDLASEGMLGTGSGAAQLNQNAWNTEANVGDTRRSVMLLNEAQKRDDMKSFTDIANGLLSQGLTYEQIRENINAVRRSEGLASLQMYLQYVLGMAGSYGG